MSGDKAGLARTLRNNATPEERALWRILSSYRPRFTRQLKIDHFVADFACRRARLIVELDGSQHVDNPKDNIRTAALESAGWHVIRFWNRDVRENVVGVAEAIIAAGNARLPEGEWFDAIAPRTRAVRNAEREEPPPPPPRRLGGE